MLGHALYSFMRLSVKCSHVRGDRDNQGKCTLSVGSRERRHSVSNRAPGKTIRVVKKQKTWREWKV